MMVRRIVERAEVATMAHSLQLLNLCHETPGSCKRLQVAAQCADAGERLLDGREAVLDAPRSSMMAR
jgi:hypothetical protein